MLKGRSTEAAASCWGRWQHRVSREERGMGKEKARYLSTFPKKLAWPKMSTGKAQLMTHLLFPREKREHDELFKTTAQGGDLANSPLLLAQFLCHQCSQALCPLGDDETPAKLKDLATAGDFGNSNQNFCIAACETLRKHVFSLSSSAPSTLIPQNKDLMGSGGEWLGGSPWGQRRPSI